MITLKAVIDEDYSHVEGVAMVLAFPYCSFKCCRDAGFPSSLCHNNPVSKLPNKIYRVEDILKRYLSNPISNCIVCAGLEPIDSISDLLEFISYCREDAHCDDPIAIYTGYRYDELPECITLLGKRYSNIILKVGRFIPNYPSHIDPILKVPLASPNQYAIRL